MTATLEVSVGTNQSGGSPVSGRAAPVVWSSAGQRRLLAVWFSRGSTKKSSGAAPLLVTVTGTVTGVPAASVRRWRCRAARRR